MAIGLRHRGKTVTTKIGTTRLQAGDALLIEVRKDNLANFNGSNDFVFINTIQVTVFKREKMIPSLLVLAGVVTVAGLGLTSIVVSAIAGSVLLVLMRTITLEEAYKAIDWRVIFLLAGAITLGIALDRTGATQLFSNGIISAIGPDNPYLLVSAFYFITFILTSVMSNTATVALIAPIAIFTSESLGIDSRPLLIAVMFAASADFMTPIGYQTNTMIYSAGRYKFLDFFKVGSPLDLIFWITATLLIPVLFPF
jgi:di/tricarboxylate transporter